MFNSKIPVELDPFGAHNLWEIGDPRNRNPAVNRRSVLVDRGDNRLGCVGEDDCNIGEAGERTSDGGQCPVRQRTRHDTRVKGCFWHTKAHDLEPRMFA